MVLVRLAYVADLPAPADLVKTLSGEAAASAPPQRSGIGMTSGAGVTTGGGIASRLASGDSGNAAPRMALAPMPAAVPAPALAHHPRSFAEVVALFDQKREAVLRSHLFANVHVVKFEPGRIEFRPTEGAPRDLANRLGKLLSEWTGERWVVSISQAEGEPTLKEHAAARDETLRHEAAVHPLVRAVLDFFPGARIEAVRDISGAPIESEAPSEEHAEGDEAP
jgi:DNA polymerase-3 subunit gamma/tau